MPSVHPARAKAQLRTALAEHRILTVPQLQRYGWMSAARSLGLPVATRSCRRATHARQYRIMDVDFVALRPTDIDGKSGQALLHLAVTAEACLQVFDWEVVRKDDPPATGLLRPDAVLKHPATSRHRHVAVEADTGYPPAARKAKLFDYDRAGFGEVLWATTIPGRVTRFAREVEALSANGRMKNISQVHVMYVDAWSDRDPYAERLANGPLRITVTVESIAPYRAG